MPSSDPANTSSIAPRDSSTALGMTNVAFTPKVVQTAHERFGELKNFINCELSRLELTRRVLEEGGGKLLWLFPLKLARKAK